MNQHELFNIVFDIDENLKRTIGRLQDTSLFNYRLFKLNKLNKIAKQKPFENNWRLVTVESWKVVLDEVSWGKLEYIDNDFFVNTSAEVLSEKIQFLDKAIVIMPPYPPQAGANNLQALKQFSAFYHYCPNTLFLGWDWDNHFNLHISSIFSAASDIYYPTHLANDYELSNFCNHKYHLPSSAYQWGRWFLSENIDLILRRDRKKDAFGRFKKYGLFGFRNAVVTTLSSKLSEVTLVDELSSYHALTLREKLEEWTRYKCHWIVPTLNDVSTRIFDVLITGGILIVPEKFRFDPAVRTINELDCLFYNDGDILNPENIIARAIKIFDDGGIDGVLRRHRFALDFHNLDSRVKEIIDIARGVLDKSFS